MYEIHTKLLKEGSEELIKRNEKIGKRVRLEKRSFWSKVLEILYTYFDGVLLLSLLNRLFPTKIKR